MIVCYGDAFDIFLMNSFGNYFVNLSVVSGKRFLFYVDLISARIHKEFENLRQSQASSRGIVKDIFKQFAAHICISITEKFTNKLYLKFTEIAKGIHKKMYIAFKRMFQGFIERLLIETSDGMPNIFMLKFPKV